MSININNSSFTAVNNYSIGVANDCSVLSSGQDLYIANSHNSKDVIVSLGKAASPYFDERFRIQNASNAGGALFTLGNSLVVRKAATQDSVALAGRAGGTSSFSNTVTTAALTASRTATLQDKTGTLAFLSDVGAAFGWNRTLQEFSSPAARIGGYTWTARTLPTSTNWVAITYGNGLFLAISGSSNTIAATSPDGVTWTARTLPSIGYWRSAAYGGGTYVAIAGIANTIA
jgi:hypothetical protein